MNKSLNPKLEVFPWNCDALQVRRGPYLKRATSHTEREMGTDLTKNNNIWISWYCMNMCWVKKSKNTKVFVKALHFYYLL